MKTNISHVLSLEDMDLAPPIVEVTEAEAVAAAELLNSTPDDAAMLIEKGAEIGQITDSGQVVLDVAERLSAFTDVAAAELRDGNITPMVVTQYARVVGDQLQRVEVEPVTLSVEAFGSPRVALESHVATVREKIKKLYEWFLKIVAATKKAIAEFFAMFFNVNAKIRARAILYKKKAFDLNKGLLHDRSSPRDTKIELNANYLWFNGGVDSRHIERGLHATGQSVGPVATALMDLAHHNEKSVGDIVHDFITNGNADVDAAHVAQSAKMWTSSELPGRAKIATVNFNTMTFVEVQKTNVKSMTDIKTLSPEEIIGIADHVIALTNTLDQLSHVANVLNEATDAQVTQWKRAAKHAEVSGGGFHGARALVQMAYRHYGNDLRKINNYYVHVALGANEVCRRSLQAYPGHIPVLT